MNTVRTSERRGIVMLFGARADGLLVEQWGWSYFTADSWATAGQRSSVATRLGAGAADGCWFNVWKPPNRVCLSPIQMNPAEHLNPTDTHRLVLCVLWGFFSVDWYYLGFQYHFRESLFERVLYFKKLTQVPVQYSALCCVAVLSDNIWESLYVKRNVNVTFTGSRGSSHLEDRWCVSWRSAEFWAVADDRRKRLSGILQIYSSKVFKCSLVSLKEAKSVKNN